MVLMRESGKQETGQETISHHSLPQNRKLVNSWVKGVLHLIQIWQRHRIKISDSESIRRATDGRMLALSTSIYTLDHI